MSILIYHDEEDVDDTDREYDDREQEHFCSTIADCIGDCDACHHLIDTEEPQCGLQGKVKCYMCGRYFTPDPEKFNAWGNSGKDFDPTDWECGCADMDQELPW